MTQGDFSDYMLAAALFAGVLGVFNLLRPNRRWLGAGAILLGLSAMLYRQDAPLPAIVAVCVAALACLVKDAASRPPKRFET